MLQSPPKKTRYPDAEISEVPSLCSTGSQQGVDVVDTVDAVDRCCANVGRTERELLQSRPRPGGLVFLAGGLSFRPLPRSFFPSKYPPRFTQFQVSSTQVLGFVLPTCWVRHSPPPPRLLHRRHFCLLACALQPFLLSSIRVPRFPRWWCPNLATTGMVATGNDLALLGCINAS